MYQQSDLIDIGGVATVIRGVRLSGSDADGTSFIFGQEFEADDWGAPNTGDIRPEA
jgi:hypothetical protein